MRIYLYQELNQMRWVLCHFILFFTSFSYSQDTARYSIVIQEIYPDPTPSRGLPSSEFIELRNRSGHEIELKNWWISNGTTAGKITTGYSLKPDSIVIITTSGALSAYKIFGPAISISSFPSLNNDGDTLVLYSPAGAAIHAIAWDKSWYRNDVKEEGGWTLEMKDINRPCLGKQNWASSTASIGGTPGKPNSVQSVFKDSSKPFVRYAFMSDSITLRVLFNEPLIALPTLIPEEVKILSANWLPPLFDLLEIHLLKPPSPDAVLNLKLTGIVGCSGNSNPEENTRFGVFASTINSQVIINELLFNPPPEGADYIELYNRSGQIIDLSKMMMGNRNSSGKLSSLTSIASSPLPFFPGDYLLITEDSNWIHRYYQPREIRMIQIPLPSYPDDEGFVVLAEDNGAILDELDYSEKWHETLVSNTEGVALERILFNSTTNDPSNWHSASSQNNYGSPGYRNSQALIAGQNSVDWITLSSPIVSPDLDGKDDILLISYKLPSPGFLAKVIVYDSFGRPVSNIANNALCGTEGYFRWNGLNRQNLKPARGTYIIFLQFYHPDGLVRISKHTVGIW